MPLVPCLDCGVLIDKGAARKQGRHKRAWGRCNRCAQGKYIPHSETRRRAQTVAEHRAQHGDWCPGWGRPSHHASDLTADHTRSVRAGGAETGQLGVLCRSCNSAKRDSPPDLGRYPGGGSATGS